jgi:inosose dehydratase
MRVGFSPITFNNEDLADLRPPVPFREVLDRVAALGYAGTERGAHFPDDPEALRSECAGRGLTLVGAWCGLALTPPDSEEADLAHARATADYVARAGGRFLNVAHAGCPERRTVAGRVNAAGGPKLDALGWQRLADRVNRAGEIAQERGLVASFHPHAGTWVETRDELDRFCALTDPALVSLCFDTGHALFGGMHPVKTLTDHRERIAYVHLKDVDPVVLTEVERDELSFEDAIRRFVFTELGAGPLDLSALAAALKSMRYEGWLMVEQDTSRLAPEKAAEVAREELKRAGLWSAREETVR